MKVDLEQFIDNCSCRHNNFVSAYGIYIEPKASRYLNELLPPYKCPTFICDSKTKKATEGILSEYFDKNKVIELVGETIHADNSNIAYLSERIDNETDILIAVGAGTIHDLTKYIAFEKGIPFISIPTAASMDGFVSTAAVITYNGIKKIFSTKAPIFVLADTDIFSKAPYRLTASGISDLMGKYTALADWKISHIITDRYFCDKIYKMEMEVVKEVERLLGKIKYGNEECTEKLMYALILSGLSMQIVGSSRTVCGAEHHIYDLWETSVINKPIDALYGEKVSVNLIMTLEKYEKILAAIESSKCKIVDNAEFETVILKNIFKRKCLYEGILQENDDNLLKSININQLENKLQKIAVELKKLPNSDEMKEKLKKAGCVTVMKELGLPDIKELTLTVDKFSRNKIL